MKNLAIFFALILFNSCNSANKAEYKIDRILVSKSKCRSIIENKSDTGFGNCPSEVVSIDKNLKCYCTKGSPISSKLISLNGSISQEIWNSIYNTYADRLLLDTSNYSLDTYLNKVKNYELVDLYHGPEFLILLFRNMKLIKTIYFTEKFSYPYGSLLNLMMGIEKKISLSTMKDTILIDLEKYLVMPPMRTQLDQKVKFR